MNGKRLRAGLRERPPVLAPGVYDALSAALVAEAGFSAAYLSGASIAYTRLGRPDIGLVAMTEVADVVARIAERVPDLPVVVDADTGFGNALNVQRTVQLLERMGAAAIQLEDQQMPKRCGHLSGKRLVSRAEMVGKLKAAVDARRDAGTVLVARTDAIAVEGFEAALDRAAAYREAGADVLFVEAPQSREQMRAVGARFAPGTPLLANMVEGGRTPLLDAKALAAIGFTLVIFPGALVRSFAFAARELLAGLARDGSTAAFGNRMLDFNGLQAVLGTEAILAEAAQYDEDRQ
jgi:2-methylisocitrate lyase-like PEP mutase family enzyme